MGLLGLEAFQTVANQGRGGRQRQGRSSQETIVQPWSKVLVQHQGTYHNIFELFTELKSPQMKDISLLHSRENYSLIIFRSSSRDHLQPD